MKFFKDFIGNFEDSGKIIADMQNVGVKVNFKLRTPEITTSDLVFI